MGLTRNGVFARQARIFNEDPFGALRLRVRLVCRSRISAGVLRSALAFGYVSNRVFEAVFIIDPPSTAALSPPILANRPLPGMTQSFQLFQPPRATMP